MPTPKGSTPESSDSRTKTLHQQVLDAIAQIPRWRADIHIEVANEWMYGRRSKDLDFSNQREEKLYTTTEAQGRARRAFLIRVLTSINHELAHPPGPNAMTEDQYKKAMKEATTKS